MLPLLNLVYNPPAQKLQYTLFFKNFFKMPNVQGLIEYFSSTFTLNTV